MSFSVVANFFLYFSLCWQKWENDKWLLFNGELIWYKTLLLEKSNWLVQIFFSYLFDNSFICFFSHFYCILLKLLFIYLLKISHIFFKYTQLLLHFLTKHKWLNLNQLTMVGLHVLISLLSVTNLWSNIIVILIIRPK